MKKFLPIAFGLLAVITFTGSSTVGKSQDATVTSLFDGKTLTGWVDQENKQGSAPGWIVTNGVLASTGVGRGTLYTTGDYSHYRLMFTMRHVSGKPDHPACFIIFCTRPKDGEKAPDALNGIQFMIPQGYHWDYRNGRSSSGGAEFTSLTKGTANPHEWSRIEVLVDATKGTARLAVAQPPDAKAVELTDFKLPEAGKTGPIALQMHNGGLFDEYKDMTIEVDPKVDDLITTK